MKKKISDDEHFMREAINLAKKTEGRTSPNPCVGAVVVQEGQIVGRGYHRAAGEPHAEVNALMSAGGLARKGTLYVTLEPCHHFGKTPPCTRAIIDAGVRRVVIGMRDPNPKAGGGADFLRSQGIDVTEGIYEEECRRINQPFVKWITTEIPYVILKAAMTLDGKIATRTGHSRWITNWQSRRMAHQLRAKVDGVCVGVGTVIADNPKLTVRLVGRRSQKQPIRIILDRQLRIPEASYLVKSVEEAPVWIYCGVSTDMTKKSMLKSIGIRIVEIPETSFGISPEMVLRDLGANSVLSILLEGGSRVFRTFLSKGLVDELWLFYASKILGDYEALSGIAGWRVCPSMEEALKLYDVAAKLINPDVQDEENVQDILIRGRLRENLY